MPIQFPTNTKTVIDEIRDTIGRPVNFIQVIEDDCPTCVLNPVTNTSSNPFCPTCSGIGYLITYSGVDIQGYIEYKPFQSTQWVSGGHYFDGDCTIQVEYTSPNLIIIDHSKYLEVDNTRFKVKNKVLRGVPEINRIILNCMEEDK